MRSLKAKIRQKDDLKITAFFITSAKINVMTKGVMENAELAIKEGPKLELVLHTGHNRPFLGLCKDIKVAISGLKIRHPIFMIETRDYNLVLEQLFLNAIKFSQNCKQDGVFSSIIRSQTQKSAIFYTLSPQDPANCTESHIFS